MVTILVPPLYFVSQRVPVKGACNPGVGLGSGQLFHSHQLCLHPRWDTSSNLTGWAWFEREQFLDLNLLIWPLEPMFRYLWRWKSWHQGPWCLVSLFSKEVNVKCLWNGGMLVSARAEPEVVHWEHASELQGWGGCGMFSWNHHSLLTLISPLVYFTVVLLLIEKPWELKGTLPVILSGLGSECRIRTTIMQCPQFSFSRVGPGGYHGQCYQCWQETRKQKQGCTPPVLLTDDPLDGSSIKADSFPWPGLNPDSDGI